MLNSKSAVLPGKNTVFQARIPPPRSNNADTPKHLLHPIPTHAVKHYQSTAKHKVSRLPNLQAHGTLRRRLAHTMAISIHWIRTAAVGAAAGWGTVWELVIGRRIRHSANGWHQQRHSAAGGISAFRTPGAQHPSGWVSRHTPAPATARHHLCTFMMVRDYHCDPQGCRFR